MKQIILLVIVFMTPVFGNAQTLFWANAEHGFNNPKIIQSAGADGSDVQTIYTLGTNNLQNFAEDVLVDTVSQKLYFTDPVAQKIYSSNFDGSGIATLWSNEIDASIGNASVLGLNQSEGILYWADKNYLAADYIQAAKTDGTGSVITLFSTGIDDIHGLEFNPLDQKLYWSEGTDGNTRIRRANLDGSMMENIVTGIPFAVHISLDVTEQKVYWTDIRTDSIHRADFNGLNSNIETVISGLDDPTGIVFDSDSRMIYWTGSMIEGQYEGEVFSASLDNTSTINTLVTGLANPRGIDIYPIPEPSSSLLILFGGMVAGLCRRSRLFS